MTDRQFLKHMIDLTVKLTDAVEHDGYRSDAYNEVLKEISVSGERFNRSRQRRSWFISLLCFVLFCILCLVVFTILF